MWSKSGAQKGMTLVELIVAIVIIAVGLAGVLSVFNNTVRASADPMVQKQLMAIAEGMMDEVMLLPFASGPGTGTGCGARAQFDNLDDFAGYTNQPVCDYDGVQVLNGYTVSVAVESMALGVVPATDARRITVTARRGAGEQVSLVSWRTNWAK